MSGRQRGPVEVKRLIVLATVLATGLLSLVGVTGTAQAKAPGPNGQISFTRQDPTCGRDCSSTFTVNPDGSHLKKLLSRTCCTNWSPDGAEISFLADCSFGGPCEATIVNPDTGTIRTLQNPDPTLYNEFFSCNRWSPDGTRLACDVVSDTPGFTGIYTVRSSDGGDLTKVLSCATECGADDWSPDGTRFDLGLTDPSTGQAALGVVNVDGTGLTQITPSGMDVDLEDGVASWSPNGSQIVFGGHTDAVHRRLDLRRQPGRDGAAPGPDPGVRRSLLGSDVDRLLGPQLVPGRDDDRLRSIRPEVRVRKPSTR